MSGSILLNEQPEQDDGEQPRFRITNDERPESVDRLSFGEELDIAVEQFFAPEIAADALGSEPPPAEENFDPFATETFEQNPQFAPMLSRAESEKEQQQLIDNRIQDLRELRALEREDTGAVAELMVDVAQPTNFLPFGMLKVGGKAATAGLFSAATAEEALIATNSRGVDFGEAALNVGLITGAGAAFGRMGKPDRPLDLNERARAQAEGEPTQSPLRRDNEPETEDVAGERQSQAPRETGRRPVRPQDDADRASYEAAIEGVRKTFTGENARIKAIRTDQKAAEQAKRRPDEAEVPEDLREGLRQSATDSLGLERTGTRVEDLPLNQRLRLLKSGNISSRDIMPRLAPLGGLLQRQNAANVATPTSVSTLFKRDFLTQMQRAEDSVRASFLRHRGVSPSEGRQGQSAQVSAENLRNAVQRGRDPLLNERQFNEAVGRAMRNNDVDELGRAEVTAAAKEVRKVLDELGNRSVRSGLMDEVIGKEIARRRERIEELREQQRQLADDEARAAISAKINRITDDIERQERRLEDIRRNGLTQNTAPSFFPRIVRRDRIDAEPERFKQILRNNLDGTIKLRKDQSFEEAINEVFENFRGAKTTEDLEGPDVGLPRSLQERAEIPDREIEDFLENDAVAALRVQTNSLGKDILLREQLGSVDLAPQINRIREEGDSRKARAETQKEANRIERETQSDIADVRELRDRIRGVAGQTIDPESLVARGSRAARTFNTLTMAGGFGTAQMAEAGNIVLANGMRNAFKGAFANLFSGVRQEVRNMTRQQRDVTGASGQITTGLTSAQFAEGDVFARGSRAERTSANVAQNIFQLSGAGVMTNMIQQWATTARMFDMNSAIRRVARDQPEGDDVQRLASVGIDRDMAMRINRNLDEHGFVYDENAELANTQDWIAGDTPDPEDVRAKQAYEAALLDEINRQAIMPDEADRATWTTGTLGRLPAQFQSFTQAAQTKILVSGMQRKDRRLIEGIIGLTAMGAIVDEIKRFQFGIDEERNFMTKMMSSIEQSGMGGLMTEGISAFEQASGGLGRAALVSDSEPEPLTPTSVGANALSVAGGPTGQQAVNLGELASSLSEGSFDASRFRRLVPGQNLPFVSPPADVIFGG